MKVIRKILYYVSAIVLIFSLVFFIDSAGVFFNEITDGIADYDVVTENQLKKNLPMQGTVYKVYDCIAVQYDTETGKDESFYYLIEFDEGNDLYMVLKTKAESQIDYDIDELCDAYIKKDNKELLKSGVFADGILVENDSGVVQKFNEWKNDMSVHGEDTQGYTLVPYTYDCSYGVGFYHSEFTVSTVILLIALAILVFVTVMYFKNKRNSRNVAPVGGNFNPQQGFNQPNNFGQQAPFIPNVQGQQPNQFGQNNYYPQNIPQPNIPQPNIPQPTNLNPNSQNQGNPSFISNSFNNPNPQGYDPEKTIYSNEERVSLDKNDY